VNLIGSRAIEFDRMGSKLTAQSAFNNGAD
jgi:hypothetical protein